MLEPTFRKYRTKHHESPGCLDYNGAQSKPMDQKRWLFLVYSARLQVDALLCNPKINRTAQRFKTITTKTKLPPKIEKEAEPQCSFRVLMTGYRL